MGMKTCFKCKTEKPIEEFYRHPQMADGHLGKCKECAKIDASMRDPLKVAAYELLRSKTQSRMDLVKRGCKRRRQEHPEKFNAYNRVSRAIKRGQLVRPETCSVCGGPGRIQAHHEDYSKPLDVLWLCDGCHKHHHVANNPVHS